MTDRQRMKDIRLMVLRKTTDQIAMLDVQRKRIATLEDAITEAGSALFQGVEKSEQGNAIEQAILTLSRVMNAPSITKRQGI